MRGDLARETVVIESNLTDTLSYNLLSAEEWKHQEIIDPEKNIGHNREVYTVWNEKINLVKIASEKNFFNSSYFVWPDMGGVRHNVEREKLVQRIPEDEGILMLNIQPFTDEEKTLINGRSESDFSRKVRVAGGTFGGSKSSIDKYHAAYYKIFKRYLSEGKFVGKDQNIMAATCLETNLCLLVQGNDFSWFRLQVFCCIYLNQMIELCFQDWLKNKLKNENYKHLKSVST